MGFLNKHTVRRTLLQITVNDKRVISISGLADRKSLVRAIIQQAAIIHHAIELKRNTEEDHKF